MIELGWIKLAKRDVPGVRCVTGVPLIKLTHINQECTGAAELLGFQGTNLVGVLVTSLERFHFSLASEIGSHGLTDPSCAGLDFIVVGILMYRHWER